MDQARAVLTRALQECGAPAVWTEWSTGDGDCPPDRRGYGSPTILVNGTDVAPGPREWDPRDPSDAPRCRVYQQPDGRTAGAPPVDEVIRAVMHAVAPDVS